MASDNTPKAKATDKKLAIQKAEEAMQSFLGKQLIQEKYQSLKLEAQVEKQKEEIEELKTTPRGRGRPKKELSEDAKDSLIKHLNKELLDSQYESGNLELHVKRLINEKASLNDKIEQLTDDVRKYEELYARAQGVAQALGKAVSILTSEVKNG
jgi:hypothetical protein